MEFIAAPNGIQPGQDVLKRGEGKDTGACGEPVVREDRHCGSCGVYLVYGNCSRCGRQLDDDDRFCPQCGEKVEVV